MFQYEARIIRIVDGDTLILDVDLGFKIHHEVTVRLARIDTPETVNYSARGIADPAKIYTENHCPVGSVCVVEISRAEKYGRWLAEILYLPGEVDRVKILANPHVLNDELVRGGFAKSYSGGKK